MFASPNIHFHFHSCVFYHTFYLNFLTLIFFTLQYVRVQKYGIYHTWMVFSFENDKNVHECKWYIWFIQCLRKYRFRQLIPLAGSSSPICGFMCTIHSKDSNANPLSLDRTLVWLQWHINTHL